MKTTTKLLSLLLLLTGCVWPAAAQTRQLRGNVPPAVAKLKPLKRLAATNELWLTLGLPLRGPAGLKQFLQNVADPRRPQYRKYVTPEQFTANWGPTEADYEAVTRYAQAKGLRVARHHQNRMLLDVTGTVGIIESALHLKLNRYRHPRENRDFFAPDTEPSADAGVPILDIEGLNNYDLPRRVGSKLIGFVARRLLPGASIPSPTNYDKIKESPRNNDPAGSAIPTGKGL